MTAEQLLEKAGAQLLFSHPFWATLLYQMERGRVPVSADVCKVAATDGKGLYYNPEEIAKRPFGHVKTILAHEAAHVAMQHHVRIGGKDQHLANIAADHVVNLILKQDGFEMPPDAVCDKRFEGQTFEQVYATLDRERQQQPPGGGGKQPPPKSPPGGQKAGGQQPGNNASNGKQPQPNQQQQPGKNAGPGQAADTPGGFGQIIPCKPEEKGKQEAEWKLAVEQAANAARGAGKLPGYLKRLVEELREAKLDWREILRAFIANTVPSDFTWSRPSRRTITQDIYLPSMKKEGIGTIMYFFDASGSMGRKQIAAAQSEVQMIHSDLKPERTIVGYFDTMVYGTDEYAAGEEVVFHPKGGGGTDFRAIFTYIDEQGLTPRCVVVFTDLDGPFPKHEPDYPVLWVSVNKKIAPFGETVRLEV